MYTTYLYAYIPSFDEVFQKIKDLPVRWKFVCACAAPPLLLFIGFFAYLVIPLPDVTAAETWQATQSVVVRDRNGTEMYYAYEDEDRVLLDDQQIPQVLRDAFIAIEDKRFYERGCIDTRALGRAVYANLSDFKSQGASTITQQLARTAHLTREKRIVRKLREIFMACRLEQTKTKEEILNLYLNWVHFGGGVAGVQQASRHYFGKDAADLTLAESAILAAIPQRPTYFDPHGPNRHTQISSEALVKLGSGEYANLAQIPEDEISIGLTGTAALLPNSTGSVLIGGRSHQVLAHMLEQGYISEEEKKQADAEILTMKFRADVRSLSAPHYVLGALQSMEQHLPEDVLRSDGIIIESTLDMQLQNMAEQLISKNMVNIRKKYGAQNAALLLADLETKEILAYVGNDNYFAAGTGAKVDMVRAPRQPGSSFKPFVYAAAMLHSGWKPYTIISDSPVTQADGYRPRNYDGGYMGDITVLKALNYSRNIPAIKAFYAAESEDSILRLTSALGAPTPEATRKHMKETGMEYDYGWPLAIGAAETPLIEMVQAYATLANNGVRTEFHDIRSIKGKRGEMLYESQFSTGDTVLPASIADSLTSMLSEWRSRPEGYWQSLTNVPGVQEAVKTGTSNACLEYKKEKCVKSLPRDLWAIGYTPRFIVGVWIGNADGTPLAPDANGLAAAVPIWRGVLEAAHKSIENEKIAFEGGRRPYYSQHPGANPENFEAPSLENTPTWIGLDLEL